MQNKRRGKRVEKRLQSVLTPLTYLAYNHEGTVEDMAREAGKDYTTILRVVRLLVKKGFVKLSRLERTGEKGREKRYYRITIYGLEAFLGFYLDFTGALPGIREIASAHQDMLLSFAKWQKFIEAGCEKACIENLKECIRAGNISRYVVIPLIMGSPLVPESEQWTRKMYDYVILGFYYMQMPRKHAEEILSKKGIWEEMLKLWEVVENDHDLRRLREEYMFVMEQEYSEALRSFQEWRLCLNSLRDSAKTQH